MNLFTKRLDEQLLDHLEKIEEEFYYLQNPLKKDIQNIEEDLFTIYNSYGCTISVMQKFLGFLETLKKDIEKRDTQDFDQTLKLIDLLLSKEKYLFMMPGKGIKGEYIKLDRILQQKELISNKIPITVAGEQIKRDGKPIQGLKISSDKAIISAYHFTNESAAKIISDSRELLIKNIEDPYIYLLEILDYSSGDEKIIRHLIGSNSASVAIKVKLSYPIEKLWLKIEKGRPTHFAIEGDINLKHLLKQKAKQYIITKKISQL